MVVSLGEGKRTEWTCQRRLHAILIVLFDLEGECFNYMYDAYVDSFFLSTRSWYIPRLETFANCDPSAPEYLGRICGIFFFPFSFFIKNWEKHLWRMLLRPILLILEPSHCLSTASFDILSHFPRSGIRGGVWSQLDSPCWRNSLAAGTVFAESE